MGFALEKQFSQMASLVSGATHGGLDFGAAANAGVLTQASALQHGETHRVNLGSKSANADFFAPTQAVKADGSADMEMTPESKARIDAQSKESRFTPAQAFHFTFARLVNDKSIPAPQREAMRTWLRNSRVMGARGGRAFNQHQLKTGRDLFSKISPTMLNGVDKDGDARKAVSNITPQTRVQKLESKSFAAPKIAMAQKTLALQPKPRTSMTKMNPYAALKAMSPEGMEMNIAATVIKLVAPKPAMNQAAFRPAPSMSRRRTMQYKFG